MLHVKPILSILLGVSFIYEMHKGRHTAPESSSRPVSSWLRIAELKFYAVILNDLELILLNHYT